jgi:hypothetical protein
MSDTGSSSTTRATLGTGASSTTSTGTACKIFGTVDAILRGEYINRSCIFGKYFFFTNKQTDLITNHDVMHLHEEFPSFLYMIDTYAKRLGWDLLVINEFGYPIYTHPIYGTIRFRNKS